MVSKAFSPLIILTLPALLLFSSPLKGQVKDAGLWTTVSFEAKLGRKLSLDISQEFRFNENITELGTAYTDAGLTYKLNKHFQIAANYRYTQKRTIENYYSFRHRIYIDIKYEKKIKPFQVQFRSRFQDQYSNIGRAPDDGVPEFYLRNKLNLKWDLDKPFAPYLSVELFSPLNYPGENAFDNIWTAAGLDYEISKHHKVEIYYMIQKEVNVSKPQTDFILGLGYFYKL